MNNLNLNNNLKYLLFVGSGRTGSTLLGQILNNHPEILISNEERILNKCNDENKNLSSFIKEIIDSAMFEYTNGSKKYKLEIDSQNNLKKWQKDWKDIDNDKKIKKTNIKYIGDKKQGGNSSIIRNNKNILKNLIDMEYVPITIVRHPHKVYQSYLKVGFNSKLSAEKTVQDLLFGIQFTEKNNGLIVHYENLIKDTESFCIEICKFLEIKKSKEWIELSKNTVNDKKNEDLEEVNLELLKTIDGYEFLIKYFEKTEKKL